jgi:hypothetical protein
MDAHKNFAFGAKVAVAPAPALSGGQLTLEAGGGALMPAAPFNATAWPDAVLPLATNAEIVRVTAVVGDVLTIVRAQEGSAAKAIAVGYQFMAGVTAKTLTDIEDAISVVGQAVSAVSQAISVVSVAVAAADAHAGVASAAATSADAHVNVVSQAVCRECRIVGSRGHGLERRVGGNQQSHVSGQCAVRTRGYRLAAGIHHQPASEHAEPAGLDPQPSAQRALAVAFCAVGARGGCIREICWRHEHQRPAVRHQHALEPYQRHGGRRGPECHVHGALARERTGSICDQSAHELAQRLV